MRRLWLLLALLLALLPHRAGAEGPVVVATLRRAAPQPLSVAALAPAAVNWRVVYLVGAVDGVDGPSTTAYVGEARTNAAQLRALGMTVLEFYPPDNHWADVVAAAADADVFIYAGHGVSWGGTPPTVGGFSLQGEERVTPEQVRADLRPAPGAVLILSHVCFAGGGSSTDSGPITSEEAQRRVAQYAQPFLEAGFAGYYASIYNGFPVALLSDLAGGMSLGQAYEDHFDFDPLTVERYQHPAWSAYAMWLDKDVSQGVASYYYAFTGDQGLRPLSPPLPQLTASPEFVQARTIPGAGAIEYPVVIDASGSATVAWSAAAEGGQGWLSLTQARGVDSDRLWVRLQAPAAPGTYTAQVRVVGDPPGAAGEVLVPVTLIAAPPSPFEVRLPAVLSP